MIGSIESRGPDARRAKLSLHPGKAIVCPRASAPTRRLQQMGAVQLVRDMRPRCRAALRTRSCMPAEISTEGAPQGEEDGPRGRRIVIAMVVVAILVAAYTGFRMPSRWCATLDAVSLFDGFHRRFVVGTVLRPLAIATDFDYWLFAGFSFAVLLAVLSILIVAAARA